MRRSRRVTDGGESGSDEVDGVVDVPVGEPVRLGHVRRHDHALLVGADDRLQQRQQIRLIHATVLICTHASPLTAFIRNFLKLGVLM